MGAMWKLLPPEAPTHPVLDEVQESALTPHPGVTVVLGGPGTGKSAMLVELVARRVLAGTPLGRIAVLAGSRAAAQQLRRTIVGRVGRAQTQPVVTTVHGLALGLLRDAAPRDERPWTLLRAPQQEERIRDLLQHPRVRWPEGLQPALGTRGFARQLRELLARIRQRSWDEEQLADLAEQRGDETLAAVADFLDEYLAVGDLEGSIDYAELVHRTRIALHDADVGLAVRARLDLVVVDDAHDLDPAQTALLADVAELGIPLTALGDPDQVVSGFRGATAQGLLQLAGRPGARTVQLEDTHRHGRAVAAAVGGLRRRLPTVGAARALRAARDVEGEVTVRLHRTHADEQAAVADELRRAVADGARWSDLAVCVRAGRAQLVPWTRALLRMGIPVEVAAEELVIAEDPAAALLLDVLALAADGGEPGPERAARLLTSPLAGLDAVSLRRLERAGGGVDAWSAAADADPRGDWAGARRLVDVVRESAEALESGAGVAEVLWECWTCSSWPDRLREDALAGDHAADRHLDACVELFERAGAEPRLTGRAGAWKFLRDLEGEEIPADTGRESTITGTGIQLTTAHRAKGRQWQRVWCVEVQEGRWPRATPGGLLLDPGRLLDGAPRTVAEHVQEERRLFLLACARAGTHLHVSAVEDVDERPSRFVAELGVTPEVVTAATTVPLRAAALVGELRFAAADPESSPALRRAAAVRLAHLRDEGVTAADPARWWWPHDRAVAPARPDARVRLSGSALEALLACPRRYFLDRRAGASRRSQAASFGTVVHGVAQDAQTDGLTREAMQERLRERWDEIQFDTPWQALAEEEAARVILDRFDAWLRQQPGELLGVEVPFEVPVEVEGRAVLLSGVVDRLERVEDDQGTRLKVVDLKTFRSTPTKAQVAGNVQLGLYQLAVAEGAFDALADGVRAAAPPSLLLLRQDKQGLPQVLEQSTLAARPTLGDEPLEVGPTWVHDRIATGVRILVDGHFPATRNDQCRFCEFRPGCPAWERSDDADA